MKRVPLYLFLTLLTFVVGIFFTAFWMLKTEIPEVPIPKSQKLRDENFIHDSRFSKEQKKFWQKELLPRFRELPLEALSDSVDETYRMVLLPTFDAPITVRIWRSGKQHFLITKRTNGLGGFGMDKFGKLSIKGLSHKRPLVEVFELIQINADGVADESIFGFQQSDFVNRFAHHDGLPGFAAVRCFVTAGRAANPAALFANETDAEFS